MTVELKNLSVGYAGKAVVADVCATILEGSFVCLIGRNGAGKSTLLRTVAGILPPVSGDVLIDGRILGSLSAKDVSTTMGVVLTEPIETPNLTVRELVQLGRIPHTGFFGTLTDTDAAIVDTALQQVYLSRLSTRRVSDISDGERQKVLIAKALAQQTPVVLLDEPTSFLDFSSKVELLRLLSSLAHDSRKTIFATTHDISLAHSFADELWLVDNNAVIVSPSSSQITDFVGPEAAPYLSNL